VLILGRSIFYVLRIMINNVKSILKSLPGVGKIYSSLRHIQLQRKSPEEVFAEIFENNYWGDEESLSGGGSNKLQTKKLFGELPGIFLNFNIKTVLDIPCGDFHWMKEVDLTGVNYIGADIVSGLIERNKQFESESIKFERMNLITGPIPTTDLVFCRDCLVHFSYENIIKSLHVLCNSNSKYFLTTSFRNRVKNSDIATGEWRPLNLEAPPFNFPNPLYFVIEDCTEQDGEYSDKALVLWKVDDIRKCLIDL
jgi:hypothetical protein